MCLGGATGAAAEKSYPRSTDYASDRWLQVFDVTTNTFTVQVLDTIPSTNVDPHTFVSAVSNGIKKAVSTVELLTNHYSLVVHITVVELQVIHVLQILLVHKVR